MSLDVRQPRYSRLRPFVITHFNAVVSNFRDCFRQVWMSRRNWRLCSFLLLRSSLSAQPSFVRRLSFSKAGCCRASCCDTLSQSFYVFYGSKNVCVWLKIWMLFEVLLSHYRCFVSSWNETGVEIENVFRYAWRCYRSDVIRLLWPVAAGSDTVRPLVTAACGWANVGRWHHAGRNWHELSCKTGRAVCIRLSLNCCSNVTLWRLSMCDSLHPTGHYTYRQV